MFEQQNIAALAQRPMVHLNRRRGIGVHRRYGMQGFGDNAVSVSAVQQALNNAYSPSGTVLNVDGVWGSKSAARMREFQTFTGYPANGNVNDHAALVMLGLAANAGNIMGSGASRGADSSSGNVVIIGYDGDGAPVYGYQDKAQPVISGNTPIKSGSVDIGGGAPIPSSNPLQSLFDALTLKGVRDAAQPVTQAAINQASQAGTWTTETAKAAAKAGGDAAASALKWLSDNGDLFAKIALGLGVAYSTAIALMLGGGGLLLVFMFSGKKR